MHNFINHIIFSLSTHSLLRNINVNNNNTPASVKYYPDFTVDKTWEDNTTTWTWAGTDTPNSKESSHYLRISVSVTSHIPGVRIIS